MTQPVHKDRRNAAAKPLDFHLSDEALVWHTEDGEWGGRMPFDTVRQVRLSVEMAGQASQVVCRVTDADGREAVFGTMRWLGPGRWEPAADTFQVLLRGLHASLLPHAGHIRFLEGQSIGFMLAMFFLGGALALVGAVFFVLIFMVREQATGLVALGGIAAGLWLMTVFRPRHPRPYDPQIYAEPPAPPSANPAENPTAPAQGPSSSA